MKRLYLIRHAKSSWKEEGKSDHERPLNSRGEKDAPFMAKLLKDKNIIPDLFISSDAVRAKSTAEKFAKVFNYPKDNIILSSELYLAGLTDFMKQITSIGKETECCFLFSHNPGISGIAYYLTGNYRVDMPTCAVFGIEFDIEDWCEVTNGSGRSILYEYPKMH